MHIHRLSVQFHEYCLMKIFMETLEAKARVWYDRLPPTSLYSLKDFYLVFHEHYKESYPSIVLVENFCGSFDNLVQHMGIDVHDEGLMNEEIKEDLFELTSHQKIK